MTHYSKEQNQGNTSNEITFCQSQRNLSDKYGKEIKITGYHYKKCKTNTAKTTFERVIDKTAEAIREMMGNNVAEKLCNQYWIKFGKSWRNSYFTREKTGNTKGIKTGVTKWNTKKHLNHLTIYAYQSLRKENESK